MAISGSLELGARWVRPSAAAILVCGSACMVIVNASDALNPKQKEPFSFDRLVQSIGPGPAPGVRAVCDSLDSALILALKASHKYPDLLIVVDPKTESKASIETRNSNNNIPNHE